MRHVRYIPAYDMPPHGFSSPVETGFTCSLCGEDIAWWAEDWVKDENGKICHAKCVEKGKR